MNLDQIMEHYKVRFLHQLADRLDLTPHAVYSWNRQGVVPYDWQKELEKRTNGALSIDSNIKPPPRGRKSKVKTVRDEELLRKSQQQQNCNHDSITVNEESNVAYCDACGKRLSMVRWLSNHKHYIKTENEVNISFK